MKTCSRCKQIKPDQSFRKQTYGDKLDSHCWHCRRESRNESRRRYPDRKRADAMVYERNRADPAVFAYLTAKHIENYLTNAIKRWERSFGIEAHPNLTAIRQLAHDLSVQTEGATGQTALAQRQCELCSETFEPVSSRQRYCCKAHADRANWQRKNERLRERQPPRPPKPPKPEPAPRTCARCGNQRPPRRTRYCCNACSSAATQERYEAWYAANRDELIRKASEHYYRNKDKAPSDSPR